MILLYENEDMAVYLNGDSIARIVSKKTESLSAIVEVDDGSILLRSVTADMMLISYHGNPVVQLLSKE